MRTSRPIAGPSKVRACSPITLPVDRTRKFDQELGASADRARSNTRYTVLQDTANSSASWAGVLAQHVIKSDQEGLLALV
jgi:hypothetical protein